MWKNILLCFCLLSPLTEAHASVPTVFYDGRPLDIQVSAGKVTQVIFPDKVAKIIKGGGSDTVLIEVLDQSIFILPKTEAPADIFVTSVKGESYPLNLIISASHQPKVEVVYAFGQERSTQEARLDVMNLMKVMLQGRIPAGATIIEGNQSRQISNDKIRLTLKTVFDLPNLMGLVFLAENESDASVIVPVEGIKYTKLLAITSDSDVLSAKGKMGAKTKVYIVVGK